MMKTHEILAIVALTALTLACRGDEKIVEVPTPWPEEPPPVKGTLEFEPTSEEPLLQLSYEGGMIKDPDPTPFVRVYPNGRVLIHYPAYMKKAGDYELDLSLEEVQELLASFADESLLVLEPEALQARTSEALSVAAPLEIPDTHGVATVVQIRADSFTREGEDEPALMAVDHRISATNLAATAKALPQFRRLQDVARGVKGLEALADRADIEPVNLDESNPGGGA